MLDAFIIDRIRRERERRDAGRIPLHVEVPTPEPHRPRVGSSVDPGVDPGEDLNDPGRGAAIIQDDV